jgi:hypothetical protein
MQDIAQLDTARLQRLLTNPTLALHKVHQHVPPFLNSSTDCNGVRLDGFHAIVGVHLLTALRSLEALSRFVQFPLLLLGHFHSIPQFVQITTGR